MSSTRNDQRQSKSDALQAWFDMTTDRIVRRGVNMPRKLAVMYAHYFEASKNEGSHMTRREHYAYRVAQFVAARTLNYELLLTLLVPFVVGLYVGYSFGRTGRLW